MIPLRRTNREIIADHVAACENAKQRLAKWGPQIIRRLMKTQSLREVGRRSQISPTYLSMVLNGDAVISAGAYLAMAALAGDVYDEEQP